MVVCGGHGNPNKAEVDGITAEEVETYVTARSVDLSGIEAVYFCTCHQGQYTKEWSKALGDVSVYGEKGTSYSNNSARFIVDVLSGKPPEEAYKEYLKGNKEMRSKEKELLR